ncbi:MAG: molybdopterin-dependent oxidoreductase [Deltaproteobacteria bacterium]|nr:molybdopterin-dependent oxidoreductase [Deltaproteobacteria bacterium]
MTNSIPEIEDCDLLFVIGSNTTEAHPVIAMAMKKALHKGAKLIVADPRAIWLTHHADLHIQHRPGSDVWLVNAMMHVVLNEGLHDQAYIDAHCENFEALAATVADYAPEMAEAVTGVPAAQIRQAARMYATTKKAGIFYTLGITEHTHGTDNVYCLADLVAITGHLGVRSAGLNPLRGQNNVQGAGDLGAHPDNLPGVQKVADPVARERYEKLWGVPLPTKQGLTLTQMMTAVEHGAVHGLFVMGEDIVVSEPNAAQLEAALNRIEFLVVQEIFPSETMRFAHVVFPAGCFAEKDGTFTNTDRRVQRVRGAVQAPGQARPDWQILVDLMRACGYPTPAYQNPGEIWAEMSAVSPRFVGISHERLDRDGGIQWPCPTPDHPGTPTLHVDRPMRGKVLLRGVAYRPPVEPTDDAYPLVLSTGRVLYHYNAANQTTREKGAALKVPNNFLEMHRYDAKRLGVKDGERVRVISRRGAIEVAAMVSPRMKPGLVWMPLHNFGDTENRVNLLTIDQGDPVTGTPEYKVCAVRVERVG